MGDVVWLTSNEEVEDFCTSYPVSAILYLVKENEEQQLFLRHYAADAAVLRKTHPQIRLAAIDEMEHPDAMDKMVMPLPCIAVFFGDAEVSEYRLKSEFYGDTDQTLQDYFNHYYFGKRAHTVARLTDLVFNADGPVVLQLNSDSDMLYWSASWDVRHVNVDRTLTDLVARKYGLEIGSDPMWVRVEAGNARIYQGAIDVAEFKEFARGWDITRVVPFTGKEVESAAQYVYRDPADLDDVRPALDALSRDHQDLPFVTVDANEYDRASELGLGLAVPFFAIEDPYITHGIENPTSGEIKQLVADYHGGQLKSAFRSEPEPTEVTNPLKLVGSTLDQALSDTSKTYFIRFFNKQSQEVSTEDWRRLAEHFNADPTVKIAELNLSLNSAEASPGCYLYPAGAVNDNGQRVPIAYRFRSLLRRLIDFVDTKGDLWPWVMKVGQNDVEDIVSKHRVVVVERYQESSERSRDFSDLTERFKDSNPDVKFVQVAGTDQSEDVYYEGEKMSSRSCLEDKVDSALEPPVHVFDNEDILKSFVNRDRHPKPLVVQLNTSGSSVINSMAVCRSRDYCFIEVLRDLNHVVATRYHTTIGDLPTWMVIHPESYGDVRVYTGELERKRFGKFLDDARWPLFGRFEGQCSYDDGRIQAVYLHDTWDEVLNLKKPMEALARLYPQFSFEFAHERAEYLWNALRKSWFVIDAKKPYFLDPEYHVGESRVDAIEACLKDFMAGKQPPPESEPLPCEYTPYEPMKIVALNHQALIEDVAKDVLIYYDDKNHPIPVLNKVAAQFSNNPDILIGFINYDLNPVSVPGSYAGTSSAYGDLNPGTSPYAGAYSLPMLLLYPAHGKTLPWGGLRKPTKYLGPLNVTSIATFVTTGSPVIELTAETYPDFVKTTKWAVVNHYRSSCPTHEDAAFFAYALDHREPEHHELLLAQIDLDRFSDIPDWNELGSPVTYRGDDRNARVRVVRNSRRRRKCSTSESSASRTMPRTAES
ncbi:hypothetical protein DICA4_F08834 [Diutina catenulata]